MSVDKRVVAISAGLAVLVAGGLAAPAFFPEAFASEPQKHLLDRPKDLFPAPKFDPKSLRKYDVTLDDDVVSTEVTHRALVSKIGFGRRSVVSIVTTPSGTYSSDALVSPYVRYPGIDVVPNAEYYWDGYGRPHVSVGTSTSPWGTHTWTSITSGSFTYYSSNFTRGRR